MPIILNNLGFKKLLKKVDSPVCILFSAYKMFSSSVYILLYVNDAQDNVRNRWTSKDEICAADWAIWSYCAEGCEILYPNGLGSSDQCFFFVLLLLDYLEDLTHQLHWWGRFCKWLRKTKSNSVVGAKQVT